MKLPKTPFFVSLGPSITLRRPFVMRILSSIIEGGTLYEALFYEIILCALTAFGIACKKFAMNPFGGGKRRYISR